MTMTCLSRIWSMLGRHGPQGPDTAQARRQDVWSLRCQRVTEGSHLGGLVLLSSLEGTQGAARGPSPAHSPPWSIAERRGGGTGSASILAVHRFLVQAQGKQPPHSREQRTAVPGIPGSLGLLPTLAPTRCPVPGLCTFAEVREICSGQVSRMLTQPVPCHRR